MATFSSSLSAGKKRLKQTSLIPVAPERAANAPDIASFNSNIPKAQEIIELLGDDDDADNSETITSLPPTCNVNTDGPVPLERFLEMWKQVEEDDGWETMDFEATSAFRRANTTLADEPQQQPLLSHIMEGTTTGTLATATTAANQSQAQYGRLLFRATHVLFTQIANLQWFHRFVDIGHGVGNTVLQAAYTVGCESLGIELVGLRHERALVYQDKLKELDDLINKKRDGKHYAIGKVRMRHGSLHAPEHLNFLTVDVDVAFCNNFGNVFGYRSLLGSKRKHSATTTCSGGGGSSSGQQQPAYTMDDYLVGLFTQMKEGAVLITLSPLPLGPSVQEADAIRARHGLSLPQQAASSSSSNNNNTTLSSFYTVQDYALSGKDLLSWTQKPFVVYKYTRVGASPATFLCCNPNCHKAREATPIVAFCKEDPQDKSDDDKLQQQHHDATPGAFVLNHCDCRMTERTTRTTAKFQCRRIEINVP